MFSHKAMGAFSLPLCVMSLARTRSVLVQTALWQIYRWLGARYLRARRCHPSQEAVQCEPPVHKTVAPKLERMLPSQSSLLVRALSPNPRQTRPHHVLSHVRHNTRRRTNVCLVVVSAISVLHWFRSRAMPRFPSPGIGTLSLHDPWRTQTASLPASHGAFPIFGPHNNRDQQSRYLTRSAL